MASGSACASAAPGASHVLEATGMSIRDAECSLRMAVGRYTTEAEVTEADLKPDYPCAIDTGGVFISKAGVMSLPCVLLIDTNNVVRYLGHPAAVTTNSLQTLLKSED